MYPQKNKVTKRYSINMCDGHPVYTTLNIVNKKLPSLYK